MILFNQDPEPEVPSEEKPAEEGAVETPAEEGASDDEEGSEE